MTPQKREVKALSMISRLLAHLSWPSKVWLADRLLADIRYSGARLLADAERLKAARTEAAYLNAKLDAQQKGGDE